ncbi:MAG: hypothetical protein WD492_10275 [Alkalispirochaeta sp.]
MRRPPAGSLVPMLLVIAMVWVAVARLPADEAAITVTTANRETGEIPVVEKDRGAATISVWNMYEAGLPSRARIAEIERTAVTEGIEELNLWNLTEPMEWSILESFPNLKKLSITGMTFERGLLFDQGAPVEQLFIAESHGLGTAPTFSLAHFPELREFAYFVFDTEEIPLFEDIPDSLEVVTFLFNYEIELRSVPAALEVLHDAESVREINISPLRALPPVFRRIPELREDLGPFQ